MNLVENIRFLCRNAGTSIPKLEKLLHFGNGAIYNWDDSSPSVDRLQKVADYFGVTTDFIINGFDKEIVELIKSLARTDNNRLYFPNNVAAILKTEIEPLKKEYYDVPLDFEPEEMIGLLREFPVTVEFKEDLLNALKRVKQKAAPLSPKEERDIARDLERTLSNLDSNEALAFDGEPLTEEDKELLKISLENSMRLAKQIAKKKFTPKKYKK